MNNIALYILIASATIASPGPGVILSITNSLTHGRKKTAYGILGISLGMLGVAIVSATSIGLVIATSKKMFLAIQLLGAMYIFYLGFKMAFGKRKLFVLDSGNTLDVSSTSAGRLFKEGLLTSLSNPKPILFFMAVFPQFIDTEQTYLSQFLILASAFCLLVLLIHFCYAEAFALASRYLWKAQDNLYLITKIGGVTLMFISVLLFVSVVFTV
ncbi:LysE family translocator [Psychrobacter sp. T6-5]